MGGMEHGSGMNMGMGMGMSFEHVEGFIVFLQPRSALPTPEREQWKTFAVALRRNAEVDRTMHNQMMGSGRSVVADLVAEGSAEDADDVDPCGGAEAVDIVVESPLRRATEDQRQKVERLLLGTMGML